MIKIGLKYLILSIVCLGTASQLMAQDPHRFDKEIRDFEELDKSVNRYNLLVFTGSSSVRFWSSLQEDFPDYNIINRGFGGSQMSDLLFFSDRLICQYQPKKVFIYEGDNDISVHKTKEDILKEAKTLADKIWAASPDTEIYFISAKPSVARWNLKNEYEQFNYSLSLWALLKSQVHFIDVWTPMLGEEGQVMSDLFIGDNLHMNAKGYKIWADVIRPFIND